LTALVNQILFRQEHPVDWNVNDLSFSICDVVAAGNPVARQVHLHDRSTLHHRRSRKTMELRTSLEQNYIAALELDIAWGSLLEASGGQRSDIDISPDFPEVVDQLSKLTKNPRQRAILCESMP
jgi:hypothetical protein